MLVYPYRIERKKTKIYTNHLEAIVQYAFSNPHERLRLNYSVMILVYQRVPFLFRSDHSHPVKHI